jgi:hypothetical protein
MGTGDNVVTFPLEGTKIHEWFTKATQIAKETNITGARVWCANNVPPQFRDMIIRNIKVTR